MPLVFILLLIILFACVRPFVREVQGIVINWLVRVKVFIRYSFKRVFVSIFYAFNVFSVHGVNVRTDWPSIEVSRESSFPKHIQ